MRRLCINGYQTFHSTWTGIGNKSNSSSHYLSRRQQLSSHLIFLPICKKQCCPIGLLRNYHNTSIQLFQENKHKDNRGIVLYDSLTSTYKPVQPPPHPPNPAGIIKTESHQDENLTKGLAWYTCGPTVYDSAHLGHARTYVCLDILHRLLLHHHDTNLSPPPIFIMNITDVDDKILARSKEQNIHPITLARHYEAEFIQDLISLNVRLPTIITRVSEHVDSDIVPYISKILDHEMAYIIQANDKNGDDDEEGGVYFDVGAFEKVKKYGKLAPSQTSQSSHESTFFDWNPNYDMIEPQLQKKQSKKRNQRDFALWKFRKKEEELYWDSPWGQGRPGWHIECSAMIEAVMNKIQGSHTLQVHAGGIDLKFPHHTNEIAQAEAYHLFCNNNREWIPHWVHTGHLHIQGSKMSKSLKNFITIREMLEIKPSNDTDETNELEEINSQSLFYSPADDFRLWCLGLSGSYRGLTNYSQTRLKEAQSIREKVVRFLLDGDDFVQRNNTQQSNESDILLAQTRKWRDEDYDFYQTTIFHAQNCKTALSGCSSNSESSTSHHDFDLDGSKFVKELIELIQTGNSYISNAAAHEPGGKHMQNVPIEPLQFALSTVRDLLSLVGFSMKTIQPGAKNNGSITDDAFQSNIKGGEGKLVDEVIHMRKCMREYALKGIKSKDDETLQNSLKHILTLCDEMREISLPSLGIEVFDDKTTKEHSTNITTSRWRWRIPLSKEEQELEVKSLTEDTQQTNQKVKHITKPENVTMENFFQVGPYEDMYLEYDETGMPLTNMDGSQVSNKKKKKLRRKRETFFSKLSNEGDGKS